MRGGVPWGVSQNGTPDPLQILIDDTPRSGDVGKVQVRIASSIRRGIEEMKRATKNSICVAAVLAITMSGGPARADLALGGVEFNPVLTITPAYSTGLPSYFVAAPDIGRN